MSKLTAPVALAPHTWISAAFVAATLTLGACASQKDSVIPTTGPTMLEIYRKHMTTLDHASTGPRESRRMEPTRDRSAFTRTAITEIESPFARLPNPDLVMYVFPHLSGQGGYPVPGYTTVFPMYESVAYALPGEVGSAAQDVEKAASPTSAKSQHSAKRR